MLKSIHWLPPVSLALLLEGVKSEAATKEDPQPQQCSLYFAESSVQPGKYGIYSATDREAGEYVVDPDLFIPILDANKNEWSPWHDMVWPPGSFQPILMESYYMNDLFMPGLGTMMACSKKYVNVVAEGSEAVDSAGVHRSKDPTAGSFTYYHNSSYIIHKSVKAGEELVVGCYYEEKVKSSGRKILNLDFLKETAVCLESLSVGESTIKGAGRGAFAKHSVPKGGVIATSPVIHFDRSQVEIVDQDAYPKDHFSPFQRDHGIIYTDSNVTATQLLLNYCYGHADSNILLLPYAPGVNFVNNGGTENSNAYVRWSRTRPLQGRHMKKQRPMELLSIPVGDKELLGIEFVAKREILPGEEILIDYLDSWNEAFDEFVEEWGADDESKNYVSSVGYMRKYPDEVFRTESEQESNPYPENLRTACYFSYGFDVEALEVVEWADEYIGCLRPCDIEGRLVYDDEEEGGTFYSVLVYDSDHMNTPESCGDLPPDGIYLSNVPHYAITIVDRPYTTDTHIEGAFRHEIGLPDGFLPSTWDANDPDPQGDFLGSPIKLKPGEMDHIYWKDTGEIVTPWAFKLGLSTRLREVMLDYCDKKGITKALRHVTVDGNGFKPGQESKLILDGQEWFLQRPGKKWHSNLHWLSPNDTPAHDDYLQALSVAGFDEILKGIGEYLNLDGLVAFHVTFIGVSHAVRGYKHLDVSGTQAKTYNVIIPLILAEDSGPELDLQGDADRDYEVGRYRYEYDVAAMMGDDAYHATSSVDYRRKKQMRLAATVYIADVNDKNVYRIMEEYTQAYPPRDAELLMSWAGRHWKPNDPSRMLPDPAEGHILLRKIQVGNETLSDKNASKSAEKQGDASKDDAMKAELTAAEVPSNSGNVEDVLSEL